LIEDELRAIVAEVAEIDPAAIGPAAIGQGGTLADAGIDSLMAMEIAVDVERRYGITFSVDELRQLSKFASLVSLTKARVAAQEAASSG
jgi:acyl carrier protein